MKKASIAMLLIFGVILSLFSFSSCQTKHIEVHSCGSGFYLETNNKYDYYIKELNITSNGNYFLLEDYFYSTELGKPYAIHDDFFKASEVYLAKKADHYNPTIFEINIDEHPSPYIVIESNMDYVHIYSKTGASRELYIEISEREIPVDITFENVNIYTTGAIPVVFSKADTDINIELVGFNSFIAGCIDNREESLFQKLENGLYEIEDKFKRSLSSIRDTVDGIFDGEIKSVLHKLLGASNDAMFEFVDGYYNFIAGKPGEKGRDGVTCFVHLGGVCFYGSGSLLINGGNGSRGFDASDSLAGQADGGDGGRGGTGIACARLLNTVGAKLKIVGGKGGTGGKPSEAFWGIGGSGGEHGGTGPSGIGYDVLHPRIEE